MKKSFSKIYLLSTFVFLFAFVDSFASVTNGTIDTTFKYARVCDSADCTASSTINFAASGGNVAINDANTVTANVTGYAWGSTLGWINMAPSGGGVSVNISSGAMSGYAWSGTSGYINFAPTSYGVTINSSGELNGHAWAGGPAGGWIKFACPGVAGDTCVKTDWRPTAGRPVVAPSGGGGGGGGGSYVPAIQTTSGSSTTATSQSGPQNQKNGDYTNSYRADINDNGQIDLFDYNSLMVNWNKSTTINLTTSKSERCKVANIADVNCDAKIDLLDFNIIMIYWGQKVKTT
jgi:hypothetical protein